VGFRHGAGQSSRHSRQNSLPPHRLKDTTAS
jgi:hypothetical protein